MRGPSIALPASFVLGVSVAVAGPAEIRVESGLSALSTSVTCADFATVASWARQHGYRLPAGEGDCGGRAGTSAVAVGWNTAAVWANALSARSGLDPAYRDAAGALATDAVTLDVVPSATTGTSGYRLPTLAELGIPRLRRQMTRLQEWTGTRVDLGDGRPYYYMCRPGACDFHSPRTSGRGVGFRLVRPGR